MKKRQVVFRTIIAFLALWLIISFIEPYFPVKFPKIVRKPQPSKVTLKTLSAIPEYDPNSYKFNQINLQSCNLSKLDLRNLESTLVQSIFDTTTIWPSKERLPKDFNIEKILELGKNPGLGIRDLHNKGITGQGVGIAIIDNPLLVNHIEYADRLLFYEEELDILGCIPTRPRAHMHGPAVASIAVGKNVGVAPQADLYYIARWVFNTGATGIIEGLIKREPQISLKKDAKAIYRILKINEKLPENRKIRVISISMGWWPGVDGYKEINKAAQKAIDQGILVLCSTIDEIYDFEFNGLGRFPLADPDRYNSYEPGVFMSRSIYSWSKNLLDGLLVPMGSRTVASCKGTDDYRFGREGGRSWAIPYIAGVYALAVQVEPNITPNRFWALAIKTGYTSNVVNSDIKIPFGWILNPSKLIEALKANELSNEKDVALELKRQRTTGRMTEADITFRKKINEKVRQLDLSCAMRTDIIEAFGNPWFYRAERQMVKENNLPGSYFMYYPDGCRIFITKDMLARIEFHRPGFLFENAIGINSSLNEVLQVLGQPSQIIESNENPGNKDFKEDILYENLYGQSGFCYYAPKEKGIQLHFRNNKVIKLSLTNPIQDKNQK